ncbi:MAG: helix-turn-helix domain-containing protein [Lachnospiraceae bacterium]|nr:helix-turn-helix domain-containing protein [Lachnospiraceae bacterium]
MERVRYMISDASNRIQVEAHVLRYWEEELELNVPRNEMGHRYYTEENIRQFEQIKKLKAEGFQLKAIKMLIHNPAPVRDEAEEAGEETDNIYDLAGVLPKETENSQGKGRMLHGLPGVQKEKAEQTCGSPETQLDNKEQRIIKLSNDAADAEQGNVKFGHGEAKMRKEAKKQTHSAEKEAQKTELAVSDADTGPISAAREEPPSKLEQFQMMMNEIVRTAIAENNRELGLEIGNQVEEKVLKELNYLMRDQEERDEERFRRLDEAIRSRQRRPPKEKRKFFHAPIHKVEEIG